MMISDTEVRNHLRGHILFKFRNLSAYAKHKNVSPAFVCECVNGSKHIPDWMLEDAGIKRVILYELRKR